MEKNRKKSSFVAFLATLILSVCITILMDGCGGGGGGGGSSLGGTSVGTQINGTVDAPSGVSLGRSAGRSAAATGLVAKSSVKVEVFYIDDTGVKTGNTLVSTITDANGAYSLTLPSGISATSSLVVAVGSGNNLMRTIVTSTSNPVNINPMLELVTSKIAANAQPLSNFTVGEIESLQAQVETDAATVNLSAETSVTDALAILYTGTLKTDLDTAVANAATGADTSLPAQYFVVGRGRVPLTNGLCRYSMDIEEGSWKNCTSPTSDQPLSEHAAFYFNGYFYLIGGIKSDGTPTDTVLRLDAMHPNSAVWQTVGSPHDLGFTFHDGAVAIFGNSAYIIGGVQDRSSTLFRQIRKIDLGKLDEGIVNHIDVGNLDYPLAGACAATFDGKILIVGGHDGGDYRPEILLYDPATQQIITLDTKLPKKDADISCIVVGNRLYVAGGADNSRMFASFDLSLLPSNPRTDYPSITTAMSAWTVFYRQRTNDLVFLTAASSDYQVLSLAGLSECTDGQTTTSGCNQTGYCNGAYKTCSNGTWGSCSKTPQTEQCINTVDDDCDGYTDSSDSDCCSSPSSPSGLQASDNTYPDKVRVTWSGSSGATSYDVYRCDYASQCVGNMGFYSKIGNTPSMTYDDTSAAAGTTYYYAVKAKNACGESVFSNIDAGNKNTGCTPTTEVCDGADNDCDGQTDENLTTTSGCTQTGYCNGAYKTCSNGTWGSCSKTPQTETCDGVDNDCDGQTDENLTTTSGCNQTGYCNGAYKTCSNGTWGNCSKTPPTEQCTNAVDDDCDGYTDSSDSDCCSSPSSPSGLQASDGTYADKVQVTWSSSSGAASYDVYRCDYASQCVGNMGFYSKIGNIAGTTYNDTSTTAGTTYYYAVKAKSACGGESVFSNIDAGNR